jgi:hypothetical protein
VRIGLAAWTETPSSGEFWIVQPAGALRTILLVSYLKRLAAKLLTSRIVEALVPNACGMGWAFDTSVPDNSGRTGAASMKVKIASLSGRWAAYLAILSRIARVGNSADSDF